MRHRNLATLLAIVLLTPFAVSVHAGTTAHYTTKHTHAESKKMTLQDRRMAADHAILLMDGEAIDRQLVALQLGVSLTRGSVPDALHADWQGKLVERRDRLVKEITAGMLHWLSLLRESQEQFVLALPAAVADVEARGASRLVLCDEGTCEGSNLSRKVAIALDSDPELETALDGIAKAAWPKITPQRSEKSEAMPFGKFKSKHAPGVHVPHVSAATLAAAVPEVARALGAADAATVGKPEARDAARQRVGAALFEALDRARKKGRRAGWFEVQICVNPGAWGGCGRGNVTGEAVDVLIEDSKLTEAMGALWDEFGGK